MKASARSKSPKRRAGAKSARQVLVRDPLTGVEVAVHSDDRGTPERSRHDPVETVDVLAAGQLRRVVRVVTQTPLDRYFKRKEIAEEQWRAGERLRRDFYYANLRQRVTAAYAEPTGGSSDDWSERRLMAHHQYVEAIQAVGQILSPVLMHVVCLDGKASEWAIAHNHQGRRAEIVGMTTLQLGLDALALHYRSLRRGAA